MTFAGTFSGLLLTLLCLGSPASAQDITPAQPTALTQPATTNVTVVTVQNPILSPARQAGYQESRLSGRSRAHHVIRLTLLLLILLLLINRRRMR